MWCRQLTFFCDLSFDCRPTFHTYNGCDNIIGQIKMVAFILLFHFFELNGFVLKTASELHVAPQISQWMFQLHLALPGCTWLYLAVPVSTWPYLTLFGSIGLYLAVPGFAWLYLTVHGCTWLYLAVPGCTWLYLAVPGYTCLYLALPWCDFLVCALWTLRPRNTYKCF